jgi:hypothetical protein
MKAEQLLQLARIYQENESFITNEETAKMSLVVPFIRLLGYDPNLPREVRLEYTAEFTQGDGKRLPDRMDFVVFDRTGTKPLMIIETKPLGTDLRAKSQQLARYISQLPDLHFGILTDGCTYFFYGDLESPNVMDRDPFFSFSLNDPKVDWDNVATFLSKFSREAFNAEGLLTDAENSRYRQAMIDKLVRVLRAPSEDESFMKWFTNDIYKGKRTETVMTRMGELAEDAVEPALLRVMGDEIIDRLKERIRAAQQVEAEGTEQRTSKSSAEENSHGAGNEDSTKQDAHPGVETTEEELQFYATVKDMVERAGYEVDQVLSRDTVNYFNVSFGKPTKWFVRFFANAKRKNISTLLSIERSRELAPGFEVEEAPGAFGVSRIYITDVQQTADLEPVILQSLQLLLEK